MSLGGLLSLFVAMLAQSADNEYISLSKREKSPYINIFS